VKLLLVSHSSNLGGTEVCFGRALAYLVGRGHEVVAAYPDGQFAQEWARLAPHVPYEGSVPATLRLKGYVGWAVRWLTGSRGLRAAIERERPDAVVVFSGTASAAVGAAAKADVRCACYVREFISPVWIRRSLWRYLGRRADLLLAVSAELREALSNATDAKIELVPDGVPIPVLPDAPAWPPEQPIVACYAGYDPEKGAITFARAAAAVAAELPDVRFRLFGVASSTHEQRREKQRLHAFVDERGLTARFDFCETSDFAPTYREASIVAVPSRSEGLGLVAIEAMSWGVPVVASACGGLLDVVEDGASGRLFAPGSDADLAAALLELLGDPGLLATMGDQARRRAEERFALDRSLAHLEQVLESYFG